MSLTKVSYSLIKNAPIDLSDYATGDGTTDDYAAIQAALTAARLTKTKLYVPPKTFSYSTTLILNDYDYIYGANSYLSILKYTGNENALITGSVNILEDIGIIGTVYANNGVVVGPNDNGTRGIVNKNIFNRVYITGFTRQGQISSAVAYSPLGGSGYDATTEIVFDAPVAGITATGTPIISGGQIVGVIVTNRGSGYTSTPLITTTGAINISKNLSGIGNFTAGLNAGIYESSSVSWTI